MWLNSGFLGFALILGNVLMCTIGWAGPSTFRVGPDGRAYTLDRKADDNSLYWRKASSEEIAEAAQTDQAQRKLGQVWSVGNQVLLDFPAAPGGKMVSLQYPGVRLRGQGRDQLGNVFFLAQDSSGKEFAGGRFQFTSLGAAPFNFDTREMMIVNPIPGVMNAAMKPDSAIQLRKILGNPFAHFHGGSGVLLLTQFGSVVLLNHDAHYQGANKHYVLNWIWRGEPSLPPFIVDMGYNSRLDALELLAADGTVIVLQLKADGAQVSELGRLASPAYSDAVHSSPQNRILDAEGVIAYQSLLHSSVGGQTAMDFESVSLSALVDGDETWNSGFSEWLERDTFFDSNDDALIADLSGRLHHVVHVNGARRIQLIADPRYVFHSRFQRDDRARRSLHGWVTLDKKRDRLEIERAEPQGIKTHISLSQKLKPEMVEALDSVVIDGRGYLFGVFREKKGTEVQFLGSAMHPQRPWSGWKSMATWKIRHQTQILQVEGAPFQEGVLVLDSDHKLWVVSASDIGSGSSDKRDPLLKENVDAIWYDRGDILAMSEGSVFPVIQGEIGLVMGNAVPSAEPAFFVAAASSAEPEAWRRIEHHARAVGNLCKYGLQGLSKLEP